MRHLWLCTVILLAGPSAAISAPTGPQLLFHCPFDGDANAIVANGPSRPQQEIGLAYRPGLFGQSVELHNRSKLRYAEAGNLNKQRGTISVWFKPNWNGNVSDREMRHILFQEGPTPSPRLGSNQLWIWSIGSHMRFDVSDPEDHYAIAAIDGWQAGEWHHIAATWDCERGTDLYIDGKPIRCRGNPMKPFLGDQKSSRSSWNPESFPYFEIGGNEGRQAAEGLIDELRVFDGVLATDAIAREFQRIYPICPIALHRYYALGREARFSWQAECNVVEPTQGVLEWLVQDADGNVVVPLRRERMSLALGNHVRDFAATISPKRAGRHELVCLWKPDKGGVPYERRLDVWAVDVQRGAAGNKEMQLDLVEKINCTVDLPREKLVQTAPTKVVHAECGTYREAAEERNCRFAVRLKLPEMDCPYVVEWDYPDDKPRTMEMICQSVNAMSHEEEYELQAGVFTGGEYPLSHRMKTLRCMFWPRSTDTALVFMTAEKGLPAAAAEVRVFRVLGRVQPAAKPDSPPETAGWRRHVGVYYEDPAICYDFGGNQETMPSFETLTDRLIAYMHYSGQDLLMYPAVWYHGPFYPSRSQGQALLRPHPYNFIEYWLTRFEAEGIGFIPTINVHNLPSLAKYQLRDDMLATGEVAAGPLSIGADGSPNLKGWHSTRPDYNILHPDVREAVLTMIDELLDLYGESPAFKGVCFHLTKHCLLWFGEKDAGYNDYCVEAFERDTGIRVPIDAKDPQRAAKRHQWLMKNARDKWLDWRCAAIRKFYGEVAERLARRRPDLRLVLAMYEPVFHQVLANPNLMNEADPIREINREGGLDPALYGDLQNVVLDRTIYPADYRWLRANRPPNDKLPLVRDLEMNARTYGGWAADGNAWVNIHDRYWEDAIGRKGWETFWGREHTWRVSTLNPTSPYALESYLVPLAHADMMSFTKGGFLIGTLGMEPELTEFSRAFRSLPAKPFTTVHGVPAPVVVRTLREDDSLYVYAVNPSQQAADFVLSLRGHVTGVCDLGAGTTVPRGETLSVSMTPMSFKAYRVDGHALVLEATGATQ